MEFLIKDPGKTISFPLTAGIPASYSINEGKISFVTQGE
jgi:hypothetical protein